MLKRGEGKDDQYSPEETARRSDELLKHMLNRPPQPHATHRPGQPPKSKANCLGSGASSGAESARPR
jgi:hypothetical protein